MATAVNASAKKARIGARTGTVSALSAGCFMMDHPSQGEHLRLQVHVRSHSYGGGGVLTASTPTAMREANMAITSHSQLPRAGLAMTKDVKVPLTLMSVSRNGLQM